MTPTKTAPAVPHAALFLAAVYGAMHMAVDFATVTSVYRAARSVGLGAGLPVAGGLGLGPFELVLGYDLMAFGLQLPLGILTDLLKGARIALVGGLVLALAGLCAIPVSAVATMVLAGLGNALFHLGAGAVVLSAAQGRAGPAGVFVAPGALGLGLGIWFGRTGVAPAWPIAGLVVAGLVASFFLRHPEPEGVPLAPAHTPANELKRAAWLAVLALLVVSVGIRSFVGFAGTYQCNKTSLLIMAGVPVAGFLGKLFGGFVSDRLGWIDTTVGALLVSAPLIAYSGGSPYAAVVGLLIFQMTMPVTLTAAYVALPTMPATAFGLPCLALIAGALPTFYPWGRAVYGSHLFLGLILASALAIYLALVLLGIRQSPMARRKGAG
jgi:MFS transporter, FSR family, fosmidomycin resistance protein